MDRATPEQLRELLRYEPETGKLFWRVRTACWSSKGKECSERERKRWNARYAGLEAFSDNGKGYLSGWFLGQMVKAHRVIWAMQTDSWPIGYIDHINGNRADNRWVNLRAASHAQNAQNAECRRDNEVGLKGVRRNGRRWMARIQAFNKAKYLGTFDTPEDARAAYLIAAAELHGAFAKPEYREIITLTPQDPMMMAFPPEGKLLDGEERQFVIQGGVS